MNLTNARAQNVESARATSSSVHRPDGALPQRKKWGGYADDVRRREVRELLVPEKQIAAICSDTWGVEVRQMRPGSQPALAWVVIPMIGISMGEIFYLKELAEDCENDGIYEFFFSGPPLIISGGTGSPINPQAIK